MQAVVEVAVLEIQEQVTLVAVPAVAAGRGNGKSSQRRKSEAQVRQLPSLLGQAVREVMDVQVQQATEIRAMRAGRLVSGRCTSLVVDAEMPEIHLRPRPEPLDTLLRESLWRVRVHSAREEAVLSTVSVQTETNRCAVGRAAVAAVAVLQQTALVVLEALMKPIHRFSHLTSTPQIQAVAVRLERLVEVLAVLVALRRAAVAAVPITEPQAATAAQAEHRAAVAVAAAVQTVTQTEATAAQAVTHKSRFGCSDEMARTQR